MMNTALMAFCGFSFIGALTVCGSMELILERIMKHIHGTGQLITLTVALGVVMITVIEQFYRTFLMIAGMFRRNTSNADLSPKPFQIFGRQHYSRRAAGTVVTGRCIYDICTWCTDCSVCSVGSSLLHRCILCNPLIHRIRNQKDQKRFSGIRRVFGYPENQQRIIPFNRGASIDVSIRFPYN